MDSKTRTKLRNYENIGCDKCAVQTENILFRRATYGTPPTNITMETNMKMPETCVYEPNSNEAFRKAHSSIMGSTDNDATIRSYTMNCSARRHNLDWSHYRTPGKQANGQGFGNPNNYHHTRYGLISRNDASRPLRDYDYDDRNMIPKDAVMWNFHGINWQIDPRFGSTTRVHRKTNSQYNC